MKTFYNQNYISHQSDLTYTGGDWIGHYNQTTKQYDSINTTNIDHSLRVVETLIHIHKDDPIIIGLEPCKPTIFLLLKMWH